MVKKKNKFAALLVGAFVAVCAVILSTTFLGSTYAKYVSTVKSTSAIQSAGFYVTAGAAAGNAISGTVVIGPGESENITQTITYFSQVNTVVSVGSGTITASGVLSNFSTLLDGFADFETDHGAEYANYLAPEGLEDMFIITITDGVNAATGSSSAEQIADLIRAEGPLGGSGVYIEAMEANETDALSVDLVITVEWRSISDAWDTYVGNEIADLVLGGGSTSRINVSLEVTIEQYLGEMPQANSGTSGNETPAESNETPANNTPAENSGNESSGNENVTPATFSITVAEVQSLLSECNPANLIFGVTSDYASLTLTEVENVLTSNGLTLYQDEENGYFYVLAEGTIVFPADCSQMFAGATDLLELQLLNVDTSSVTNMYGMFSGCENLETIVVGSSWTTSAVVSSDDMFLGCESLTGYDEDNVKADKATTAEGGYLTAAV